MSTDPTDPTPESTMQSQQSADSHANNTAPATQSTQLLDTEMATPGEIQQPTQSSSEVPNTINMDASSEPTATQTAQSTHPTVLEPRIPVKKDISLRAFLSKMDDYTPLIPDSVVDHYLTLAGIPPPPATDRRLARLLALATQKFVADVAADAYQYSRIRSTNTTSNNPLTGLGGAAGFGMNMPAGGGEGGEGGAGAKGKKDGGKAAPLGGPRAGYGGGGAAGGSAQGRTVLTMEDLGMAVGEYGVNVKRGEFYR